MFSYDFKKRALEALKGNWGLSVLTGLVATILAGDYLYGANANFSSSYNNADYGFGYPSIFESGIFQFLAGFAIVYAILLLCVKGVTELGYVRFNLNLLRGENPQFTDLFGYYSKLGKGILLVIIRGVFVFLWSLLFVIPGIVAVYRYAMMPYILAENPDMSVMDAMRKSKEMMYGNKWRLFCLHFSFIGWTLLAALTCGIGMLWIAPYMSAAEAAFYEALKPDVLQPEFREF